MNLSSTFTSDLLQSKTLLLGISGGIAAYKVCDLIRRLQERGAQVHCVMTKSACEFITPLTFQALSGHPVHTKLFDLEQESKINHIALADLPDLIVIAPATADLLAKAAHGLCDDLLTTLLCATQKPILFCPAMNVNMWNHPATQQNVTTLRSRGYHFLEPESGSMACGYVGSGRLPETQTILNQIESLLLPALPFFKNKKILITAGPTWESVDPVRYLTNPSSGKMGYALAQVAQQLGAQVTLVSGPTSLADPYQTECVRVKTAAEMASTVKKLFKNCDVFIATAAVADFKAKTPFAHKMKKRAASLTIDLEPTEDILAWAGKNKKKQLLIGFAAETQNFESEALEKLKQKNLDLICANDISKTTQGFASEQNEITLYFRNGRSKILPLNSKKQLALEIFKSVDKIN